MNPHHLDRGRASYLNQHGLIPITLEMHGWWSSYVENTFTREEFHLLHTVANAITEQTTIALTLVSGAIIHLMPTHFSIYPTRGRLYICGNHQQIFIGHINHCSVVSHSHETVNSSIERQEVVLTLFPKDSFDLERIAFTLQPYLHRFLSEDLVIVSFPIEERPQILRILRSLGSRAVPNDDKLRQEIVDSLIDWSALYE